MQVKDSSQNGKCPLLWRQVLIVVITLTAVTVAILLSRQTYSETGKVATEQFNQQQLILARSTAAGIESHLEEINEELPVLAEIPAVQAMTPECLTYMQFAYGEESRKTFLRRIDKHGILRFIYPNEGWRNELVDRDYSEETYFIESRETGERAVSGLIINEVGEMRIRVAYPVFIEDEKGAREFNGAIVATFDIEELGRLYISPIVSGKTGYAWLLNEEGIFLAHHEEGFIGRSAFEIRAEQNPDISYAAIEQIQQQMMAGEEGIGRYVSGWHRERNEEIEKLVAYTPVHIDDHIWSVAVCAPVSEVEEIVQTTKRSKQYTLAFVILSLMTGGLGLFITSLRWSRSLEQEVAKQTKALQEAEERFRTIFENVAIGLYRTTPDGRILVANPAMVRILGYSSFEELAQRDLEEEGFEPEYPRSVFKQRIESEGQIVGLEFAWTRRDGTTLFVRESARAVWDDGGNILYYEGTSEDITERKRAEEALRRLSKDREEIFQALGNATVIVDPEFNIIDVNRFAIAATGKSKDELLGKKCYEIFHGTKRPPEGCPAKQIITSAHYAPVEGEMQALGGTFLVSCTPVLNDAGHLVKIIHSVTNIIERKRMEEALRESERRYRLLAENVTDLIWTTDMNLQFTYITPSVARMLGYSVEEAMAKTLGEVLTPASLEIAMKAFAEEMAVEDLEREDLSRARTLELETCCKDGSTAWTEIKATGLRDPDGRLVGILGITRDITERRRAEDALRESEGKYRLLAENTLDAIWKMDLNLEFTYINPAVFDILGFTPEEWIGTRLPEHCSPKEMQKIANIITHELENLETRTGVVFETSFYDKHGEEIACEVNSTILFDETGKPIGLQGTTRDITKRKRAEEALRKSEQRYRSLFEGLPVGLYRMTPQGLILHANPALVQMLGYPDRRALMAVNALDLYVDAEDYERQQALLEREGLARDFEMQFRRYDGTVIWVRNTVQAVRSDRRDVFYYEGSMEDITERVQVEEALRESEEKYRTIYDNAQVGLYRTMFSDGKVLIANKRMAELWGYESTEDCIAHCVASEHYADPGTREKLLDIMREHGKFTNFEARITKRDGTIIWLQYSGALFPEKGYFEGVATDITERVRSEEERARAEREIEERRSYLESVLACAPDAIVTLDARHNILEWNSGAERLFGYTLQEVAGRNLDDLITGPDANVFEKAAGLTRQILAGGNVPPAEMVRYRKDGSPVDVIGAGSPILIGDEVIGMVAIYTDVTGRKRVERQLWQQERLAAVGQLAAGIAHDFNNTMASIILYAQMMLRTSDLSSRDRERLGTVNQEARHAANLTQQILDFSRRSVLERRPLDLLPFLKELAKLLEPALPENIKIVLAYGPDEYTVNADPTRVQQAMMNLALNARDAMPEGGELRIGLERIRVEDGQETVLPGMEAGEWVQVTVADTGTGIPPDALPHMFEPFFTTKPVGQGTGLGLAQVYGIVKQHGGEIDVESELGHGATFVIYLPSLPVSVPEVLPHEMPALAEGHGETILVVEDNPGTREALSDTLEMLNYQVLAAANGQEALEIYRSATARPATASTSTASTTASTTVSTTASTRGGARGRRGGERSRRARPEQGRRIDLVLTDVVMPGMGGRELMRELRKMNPHLKGIVVTGYPVSEDLREEGIVDVLRKPFDVGALAEVVRHALDADGVD